MSVSVQNVVEIRFSEVDSMGVVWHGNFVKYLEDGRECFGNKYGLNYMRVVSEGFLVPIVDMKLKYKKSAKYEEKLVVETKFINTAAAKIIFDYTIYRQSDMAVLIEARTVQVFTDKHGQLILTNPSFYSGWKKSIGISD